MQRQYLQLHILCRLFQTFSARLVATSARLGAHRRYVQRSSPHPYGFLISSTRQNCRPMKSGCRSQKHQPPIHPNESKSQSLSATKHALTVETGEPILDVGERPRPEAVRLAEVRYPNMPGAMAANLQRIPSDYQEPFLVMTNSPFRARTALHERFRHLCCLICCPGG